MPGQPWATAEQREFLDERRIRFATAQREKTTSEFYKAVKREFFDRWKNAEAEVEGMEGLTADRCAILALDQDDWQTLRETEIKNWFYNHALQKEKDHSSAKVKKVTIELAKSSKRVSSRVHAYSKLYYTKRVKPLVDADIALKEAEGATLSKDDRIVLINQHLRLAFANESEDTIMEVDEYCAKQKQAKEECKKADEESVAAEGLTPQERLLAQSTLHEVVADFCDLMGQRTGWSFCVLAGGEDEACPGTVRHIGVHTGRNEFNMSFRKAYDGYESLMVKPFSKFLHSVYRDKIKAPQDSAGAESASAATKSESAASGHHVIQPQNNENTPPSSSVTSLQSPQSAAVASGSGDGGPVMTLAISTIHNQSPAVASGGGPITMPATSATHNQGALSHTPSTVHISNQLPYDKAFNFNLPDLHHFDEVNLSVRNRLAQGLNVTYPHNGFTSDFHDDFLDPELFGPLAFNNSFSGNPPMNNSDGGTNTFVGNDFGGIGLGGGSVGLGGGSVGFGGIGNNYGPRLQGQGENFFSGQLLPPIHPAANVQGGQIVGGSNTAQHLLPPVHPAANVQSGQAGVGSNTSMSTGGLSTSTTPPTDVAGPAAVNPNSEVQNVNQDSAQASEGGEDGSARSTRQRARTATTKDILTVTSMATGGPEWFKAAAAYLQEETPTGAESWAQLVTTWKAFENQMGEEATSYRLPAKQRPELLSKWLKLSGRKYQSLPPISDLEGFSISWLAWWSDLQPQWRRAEEGLPPPLSKSGNHNPASMKHIKGGPSGIVAVITGLKWWVPPPASELAALWTSAVLDVDKTLKYVMGEVGTKKRPSSEPAGRKGKKTRRS